MSSVKLKFLAMSRVDLKMGVSSVDFTFCSPVAYFRAFEGKMSSVGLNFECRCRANFGLNVACRMKKWANVTCRNKAFMDPFTEREVLCPPTHKFTGLLA